MSRLYQYDAAGNIVQIKSDLGTTDYGYDKLSRLTQATPDQNLQTLGLPSEQYGYDQVHNRTSSGHQPGTWAYNADNQLTQYPNLKPFSPGASPIDTSVSYTPQGHAQKETSSQWTKDYGYNAAERLISYATTSQGQSSPALEAGYRYDPFGRRISKSVKEGATVTTYFLYSEQGLMGEADETGKLTKAYGFNPIAAQQGLWSTDPVWQANVNNASLTATDSSFHYLHTDHLGTPQLATTKEGQTSWKAASEAFGAAGILQNQSSIGMNLRFPGQYLDQETGSHYNFFRDYRPNQGRYVESDPIGLEDGVNMYAYVSYNPLGYKDYSGLAKFCCRKLGNWFAGKLFGKRHCYIISDDMTVYGLYPENTPNGKLGIPRTTDPRDVGGECVDCPSNDCENQNNCLREAYDSYPRAKYNILGPNSNTFAGTWQGVVAKVECHRILMGQLRELTAPRQHEFVSMDFICVNEFLFNA